jgi:hypothetical protein
MTSGPFIDKEGMRELEPEDYRIRQKKYKAKGKIRVSGLRETKKW